MNRMGYSTRCAVCCTDLAELLVEMSSRKLRASIHRQMSNGLCDQCQRARHAAAVEYEHAAEAVHLVVYLGAEQYGYPPRIPTVLHEASLRLKQANQECIRLKMWPATERKTA